MMRDNGAVVCDLEGYRRRWIVKGGFLKLGPCQPLLPYLCHCKPCSVIISGSSSSVRCLALAALTVRLAGSSPSVGEPGLNKSLINQGAAETSSIFIIAVTGAVLALWHSGASNHSIAPRSEQGCPWIARLPLPPPSAASARPGALIPEGHGSSRWRGPQKSQSPRQAYLCRGQAFAVRVHDWSLGPSSILFGLPRPTDGPSCPRAGGLSGCPRTTLELQVFVSRHPNS